MSVTKPETGIEFEGTEPLEVPGRSALALPGTDSIGRGYDVFDGEYANPMATRERLFDLGEFEEDTTMGQPYLRPERVQVQRAEEGDFGVTEGASSRAYQSELAASVGLEGGYGFFRGSVEAGFAESVRRCTSYHFLSKEDRVYKGLLRLDAEPREFLTERARRDLVGEDPTKLFERYGTHYLHSLIIGAHAVYYAATNTADLTRSMSFSQAAELSYRSLTGNLSAREESDYRQEISEFRSRTTGHVKVRGGRSEFGNHIRDAGNYGKWIDSIEGNMAFVALERDSLRPLWTLCEDDDRREELEAAYRVYAGGFAPERAPTVAPVYGYHAENPRRWYFSLSRSEKAGKGWTLVERPYFYVAIEPGDGRVPVYRHSAGNPDRYKLSVEQVEGAGWSDETEPVWYAYGPDAGDASDRVGIYGYTSPKDPTHSGWYYDERDQPHGWNRSYLAFYGDEVEA